RPSGLLRSTKRFIARSFSASACRTKRNTNLPRQMEERIDFLGETSLRELSHGHSARSASPHLTKRWPTPRCSVFTPTLPSGRALGTDPIQATRSRSRRNGRKGLRRNVLCEAAPHVSLTATLSLGNEIVTVFGMPMTEWALHAMLSLPTRLRLPG